MTKNWEWTIVYQIGRNYVDDMLLTMEYPLNAHEILSLIVSNPDELGIWVEVA